MSVLVTCYVCGSVSKVPASRAQTFITCSIRCKSIRRAGGIEPQVRVCATCGKAETLSPSRASRPFCSNACYGASLKKPGRRTSAHSTWRSMMRRCYQPDHRSWKYYGGRGTSVCRRWRESFEAFAADMGPRPPGRTLDRINPYGNYELGNCRWATPVEQRHNQRRDWDFIEELLG